MRTYQFGNRRIGAVCIHCQHEILGTMMPVVPRIKGRWQLINLFCHRNDFAPGRFDKRLGTKYHLSNTDSKFLGYSHVSLSVLSRKVMPHYAKTAC